MLYSRKAALLLCCTRRIGTGYLHFLRERAIRTALQALYVGTTGSNANADLLLSTDPQSITHELVSGGSALTKNCFLHAIRWLVLAREFAYPQKYQNQILEPYRSPGRYLRHSRELRQGTATVEGLAFSISPSRYKRNFGKEVQSVSVVVSELQSALTIKYPSSKIGELRQGGISVKGVQPIPLVNRLRPHDAIFGQGKRFEISGFDFAKVAWVDTSRFENTIAVERLCEVESTQFKGGHLGMVVSAAGKLVSSQLPVITVQSIAKPECYVELVVAKGAVEMIGGSSALRAMKGNNVRLLFVVWYTGNNPEEQTRYPEAFVIQPAGQDAAVLAAEELAGYVRVRGKASFDEISSEFPNLDVGNSPLLDVIGDNVIWKPKILAETGAFSIFHHERAHLDSFRKETSPFVGFEEVFDISRLDIHGYSQMLRHQPSRLGSLLGLIRILDHRGTLPAKTPELLADLGKDSDERALYWLKRTGMFIQKDDSVVITPLGLDAAFEAIGHELQDEVNRYTSQGHRGINLIEMAKESGEPISLLFRVLGEMERFGQVQRLRVGQARSKLFWILADGQGNAQMENQKLVEDYDRLMALLLSILGSVPFSLATLAIVERLDARGSPLPEFAVTIALRELLSTQRISQDGLSWSYDRTSRISDLLRTNPYESFSVAEIAFRCRISPADRDEVQNNPKQDERLGQDLRNISRKIHCAGLWAGRARRKNNRDEKGGMQALPTEVPSRFLFEVTAT